MNQILERISKALRLGKDNNNENEAQAAILAAQRLMAKYKISEEEINDMLDNTDKLIDKAIDNILEADFEINPKVINGENVSCSFCEYRDICYLREKDKVYINKESEDNGD